MVGSESSACTVCDLHFQNKKNQKKKGGGGWFDNF